MCLRLGRGERRCNNKETGIGLSPRTPTLETTQDSKLGRKIWRMRFGFGRGERDAVGIRKLVLVYPPRTPTLEMPRDSKLKEANMTMCTRFVRWRKSVLKMEEWAGESKRGGVSFVSNREC